MFPAFYVRETMKSQLPIDKSVCDPMIVKKLKATREGYPISSHPETR